MKLSVWSRYSCMLQSTYEKRESSSHGDYPCMQAHLEEREASDTVRSERAEQEVGSPSFVRGPGLTDQPRFTSPCSLLTPFRSISAPSRSLVNIQAGQTHELISPAFSYILLRMKAAMKPLAERHFLGLLPGY